MLKRLWNFFMKVYDYVYLRRNGIDTQFGYCKLVGLPIIKKHPDSHIKIGRNVTLVSKTSGNIAGINHPVILATLSPNARIELKDNSGISGATLVSVSSISIGEYSGLGVNSCVYDTDFHPINPIARRNQKSIADALTCPVVIGNDVWIAANVLVLKGVHIRDGAVVGSNSVVTKNIGERQLYAGNPARLVKEII